jgi:TonB family protein
MWTACAVVAARAQDQSILLRNLRAEEPQKARVFIPAALPLPCYPAEMLRANLEGDATLRFQVQPDGSVSEVSILKETMREFGEPAKEAVARWRFALLPAAKVEGAVWMQCRILFRTGGEDGGPMGFPGFTDTQLSGHEVFKLASDRAKQEGVNLGEYTGWRYPMFIVHGDNGLRWSVTWLRQHENGGSGWGDQLLRVWVDDKTRETRLEKKPNQALEPTRGAVTPRAP